MFFKVLLISALPLLNYKVFILGFWSYQVPASKRYRDHKIMRLFLSVFFTLLRFWKYKTEMCFVCVNSYSSFTDFIIDFAELWKSVILIRLLLSQGYKSYERTINNVRSGKRCRHLEYWYSQPKLNKWVKSFTISFPLILMTSQHFLVD